MIFVLLQHPVIRVGTSFSDCLPPLSLTFITQDTSNHRSTKHEFPSFGLLMAT